MNTISVEVSRQLDEIGEPEEFTWDLFPLIDAALTTHLDENGLPKRGTSLSEGMIVVGKIGKSRAFDPTRQPNALEIHGLPFSELSKLYGAMWVDRSVYATREQVGVVRDAWISPGEPATVVVLIERV